MSAPLFHLAFPVNDLEAAREFYVKVLGCRIGRESTRWIDFDFFGHQITAHLTDTGDEIATNEVDGDAVPARHFGVILAWPEWESLADRLRRGEVGFLIEPRVRFVGKPGEQGTLFIRDPAGNALEFKSFKNPDRVFATQ